MPKYLLVFSVRSSHVRDHSVEVIVNCEHEQLVAEIKREKKVIEGRVEDQATRIFLNDRGDDRISPWVTVVLSQVVPP